MDLVNNFLSHNMFCVPGYLFSILFRMFTVYENECFTLYQISGNSNLKEYTYHMLIIPRQKPLCSIFSDPAFRAKESTFPQNESGIGTEVALQPLVCWKPELASFVKDAVWHDRRSLVLDKWRLLWYAEGWIWMADKWISVRGIINMWNDCFDIWIRNKSVYQMSYDYCVWWIIAHFTFDQKVSFCLIMHKDDNWASKIASFLYSFLFNRLRTACSVSGLQ